MDAEAGVQDVETAPAVEVSPYIIEMTAAAEGEAASLRASTIVYLVRYASSRTYTPS